MISTFSWVEDSPVADCLVEIWSCIVELVEFCEKSSKLKYPACKNYPPVLEAVQDPLIVAKLEFFSLFASQVNGTVFLSKSFQIHSEDYAT